MESQIQNKLEQAKQRREEKLGEQIDKLKIQVCSFYIALNQKTKQQKIK